MFKIVLTSVYLGYFGILLIYLKILSNNIISESTIVEPIMEVENYDNLNMLIKNNRFKLDNYKKNKIFDNKIKKWHKKLKCIKFNNYIEIYEIPNRDELNKDKLWW